MTGSNQLTTDAKRATERAQDFQKFAEDARRIVSKRHRDAYKGVPVGDMNSLGPAIINLQLWQASADGFTFGVSAFDYAADYAEYRAAELGEPLLYTDDQLSDALFDAWADWVFEPMVVG